MGVYSTVVDTGFQLIVRALMGRAHRPVKIKWGTGTTGPKATDTGLEHEIEKETLYENYYLSSTHTWGDTFVVVSTNKLKNGSATITEVGTFERLNETNMFLRGTFNGITLNAGDSIEFTIRTNFMAILP